MIECGVYVNFAMIFEISMSIQGGLHLGFTGLVSTRPAILWGLRALDVLVQEQLSSTCLM